MRVTEAIAELQLILERHGDVLLAVSSYTNGDDLDAWQVSDIDTNLARLPGEQDEQYIARIWC